MWSSLSLSLLCTEEEEEVEFLFHLTNRWLPINAPRLLRIGSVSLVLFSLSRLSQCWARGGGDQEVIQKIFSCSFVRASKSLRWCFDFTLEYLLDDESSRVGEVVVIDDVAVVVTAATAASRQPPTYGILCLLFVCESCIFFLFLFHWERETWYNTMQTFLSSNSWLINSSLSLSLTHSRSHMLLYERMRERMRERSFSQVTTWSFFFFVFLMMMMFLLYQQQQHL